MTEKTQGPLMIQGALLILVSGRIQKVPVITVPVETVRV